MILNLNGEVSPMMVDSLISGLNSQEPCIIYLCSPGGDIFSQQVITHMINNNKERIVLVAYGMIMSAAFNIFFEADCEKILMPYTVGMAHLTYMDISCNQRGLPKTKADKFNIESIKNSYKDNIKFYSDMGFNEEELSNVTAGEDVFFSYKRLMQLWKNKA